MIERKDVKVQVEYLKCTCGDYMRHTGAVFYTSPLRYQHRCDSCTEVKDTIGDTYPRIVYIDPETGNEVGSDN